MCELKMAVQKIYQWVLRKVQTGSLADQNAYMHVLRPVN